MTRKSMLLYSIGAASVGAISYLLIDEGKKSKVSRKIADMKSKMSNTKTGLPIEQAGFPEKDNQENADMVAEGSQYGVQYYNKVKQ